MNTRPFRLRRLLLVPLALLLLTPSVTLAQPAEVMKARAAFKKAEVHFKLGEFKEALPLYKAAFRAKAMPEFLFNIGQCHRHLGDCTKANFFFRQFLMQRPRTPHKAKLEKLIKECDAHLKAGTKPQVAPVKPKTDPVKPTTDPVKPKTDPVKPKTDPVKPKADPVKPKADPEPEKRRKPLSRTWFWAGVGVTTALFATAAVTGVMARSKNTEYNDPATSIADRQALKDSGEALETVCWTTVGIGAAAAAGTAVLFWLSRSSGKEEKKTTALPYSLSGFATAAGGSLLFTVRY